MIAAFAWGCPANEEPGASQRPVPSEPGVQVDDEPESDPATATPDDDSRRSIGVATMREDGTVVLTLRAEAKGGAVGDAQLVYPKGHERYDEVLKHVGGLEPGQSKPVPPWPD
jgi:hypothetical protein